MSASSTQKPHPTPHLPTHSAVASMSSVWQKWAWLAPKTLLMRLVWLTSVGVIGAQVLSLWLILGQLKQSAEQESIRTVEYIGRSAAMTASYFHRLPPSSHQTMVDQLRHTVGTRFFLQLNPKHVVQKSSGLPNASVLCQRADQLIRENLAGLHVTQVAMVLPADLVVDTHQTRLHDLPLVAIESALLTDNPQSPMLVLQIQLNEQEWLFLAAQLPNQYVIEYARLGSLNQLTLQLSVLVPVLLVLIVVVHNLTKPLEHMAKVTGRFAQTIYLEAIPEEGSIEIRRMARAFNEMQIRILRYIEDRNRLFASISHDLRTPITRLKLRVELMDDEQLQAELHEDLDELDMMVKNALQAVRETHVHENYADVALHRLIQRLAAPVAEKVQLHLKPVMIRAKRLALRRALDALLDNGLRYGYRVSITVSVAQPWVEITLQDQGPGMTDGMIQQIMQGRMRLPAKANTRGTNPNGTGLGLLIAKELIESQGGQLHLQNIVGQGLQVTVRWPSGSDNTVTLSEMMSLDELSNTNGN